MCAHVPSLSIKMVSASLWNGDPITSLLSFEVASRCEFGANSSSSFFCFSYAMLRGGAMTAYIFVQYIYIRYIHLNSREGI